MIYRKIIKLLATQFSLIPENMGEDSYLFDDLGLDRVDLAIAIEESFELDEIDLTDIETIEDLVEFVQTCLDM